MVVIMKKSVLICNPNSGKNNKEVLAHKFETILNEYGYDIDIVFTKYAGHAKKIISELPDSTDLVISLGGDGTFNEVVTGNLRRKKKLLLTHIPLGTTNDLGATFGMGKNPVHNLKMILEGTVKELDICTINDVPFVYVAGLGKFTDVAYDTPRNLKKNFGYLAYLFNAVKSFNQKTHLFEMSYTANGETYTGLYSFVLICNASRIRQEKMTTLDSSFDLVLILGDKKSSNTTKLYDLSNKNKSHDTFFVSEILDLEKIDFSKYKKVAIFSGTSCPMEFIEEVKKKVEEI